MPILVLLCNTTKRKVHVRVNTYPGYCMLRAYFSKDLVFLVSNCIQFICFEGDILSLATLIRTAVCLVIHPIECLVIQTDNQHQKWIKCDLSDFDCCSISEAANLQRFFRAPFSRVYIEWCKKQ